MPTRKDAKGFWHVEVCIDRKRLHRRCPAGASASDAKQLEAELVRSLHTQKSRVPNVPGNPLLSELMADYAERHAKTLRSPSTARYHALRIGRWLEGKRASEARTVAAKIREDLAGHYAEATINKSIGTLKTALKQAYERGDIPQDYGTSFKRRPENNQKTLYLSMEQVKVIADAASENVRAAIWIGLLTGCRRGEVCQIKAEDIGEDIIRLPAGNTKSFRYRQVPITPALRPWLSYLPLPINFEGVKSGVRRAREKVGMPAFTYHTLRHSCATLLLEMGVPLHVIRDILGHSSIKVTERYSHAMTAPQRSGLERLGDLHTTITQRAG